MAKIISHVFFIISLIFFLFPSIGQAKSFIVRVPKGEEIVEAVLEASSKTSVRPALLYGVLSEESSLGQNLGKKESVWQNLCQNSSTPNCEKWKLHDCKDSRTNVRHYDEILKLLGYTDSSGKADRAEILTSSTCALGFTQVVPNTWWLITNAHKEEIYNPWDIKDSVLMAAYHLEGLGADESEILGPGEVIGRKDKTALQKYYCGSDYLKRACVEYAGRVEKKSKVALEKILQAGFEEQLENLEKQKGDLRKQLKVSAPITICPEVSTDDFGFGVKPDPKKAKTTNDLLDKSTREVVSKFRAYQRFNDEELLSSIQNLVGERKKHLIEAVYRDPAKAVFSMLLENDRKDLVKYFPKCIESEATIEGFLDVLHIDFEDGSGQTQYVLTKDDGSSFIIHPFGGLRVGLESSMRIRVRGMLIDKELIFNGSRSLDGKEDFTGGIEIISEPDNPPVRGEQRTIVILAYFSNTDQPSLSKEAVSDIVFGEVNRYYKELSYGKISLSGNVVGWYRLAANQSCNAQLAWNMAIRSADSDINFKEYSRVIVVAPMGPTCGWGGFATTGKTRVFTSEGFVSVSIAAIRTGFVNLTAIGHELGHNFGNHHASSYLCPRSTLADSGCSYLEYGDRYDIMGSNNVGHFNALHKEYVGWLDEGSIKNITESGIYTLSPIEDPGPGLKALKIQRKIDDFLFVEYRQPLGYDASLGGGSNVFSGALLHTVDPQKKEQNRSSLIDPTPPGDINNLALLPGMIFSDPANGATITTISAVSNALMLRVGAGKKDFTPPLVSINYPASQQTVSGKITVAASAFHRSGIERVDFYYIKRGEQIFFGSDRSLPYEVNLDTALLNDGLNYVFAKAYDPSGNEGVSNLVGFFVAATDEDPPFVDIVYPQDGSTQPSLVRFFANASDETGVYSVTFVVNPGAPKESRFQDKQAPFEASVNLEPGFHRVYAEAEDFNGKVGKSKTHLFTVFSGSPTPKVRESLEEEIEIKPPPPPSTTIVLEKGTAGESYNAALTAEGLTTPFNWSLRSGRFPPGLNLDPATGFITGAPSEPGVWDFNLKAVDSAGATLNKDFRIEISVPLTVKTRSLPNGFIGLDYTFTLLADGVSPPYTWSVPSEYGNFPPGLNLKPNGSISGKPTQEGKWGFTAKVIDNQGKSASRDFRIEVRLPLAVSTENLPTGILKEGYNGTLSASGIAPPFSWSVRDGQFPPGLSLNQQSGNISGQPAEGGVWLFRVQATDSGGSSVLKELKIEVKTPLTILTSSLPYATLGTSYNATLAVNGGVQPYIWSIDSGSLVQGLSLNSSTGVISGVIGDKSYTNFLVKVVDKDGLSTSRWFGIDIRAPLQITSPVSGQLIGNVGIYFGTSTNASGGNGSYQWSIAAGELPEGVSLGQYGYISGQPVQAGVRDFTLKVRDSAGANVTKNFSFNVKTAPVIATTTPPYGFVGKFYELSRSAAGGAPPYVWSISSGSLPEGLTLNIATGKIEGTPLKNGYSGFLLKVSDADGVSASNWFTIDVKEPVVITTSSFLNGSAGIYYSTSTRSSGGVYPYSWSIFSGELPGGLTFATSSGYISGTPNTEGVFNFSVRLTDGAANNFTKDFVIEIKSNLNITNPYNLPSGTTSLNYSITLSPSGGTPPYVWEIYSGSLPPGLSLDTGQGIVSGAATSSGTFGFTIKITDSHGVRNYKYFSIKINPAPSALIGSQRLRALLLNSIKFFSKKFQEDHSRFK